MARKFPMLRALTDDRAVGLKRCVGCGAYAEAFYNECPRCAGDYPDFTEDCPTCANTKREGEDGCATCMMLWLASPRPYDLLDGGAA